MRYIRDRNLLFNVINWKVDMEVLMKYLKKIRKDFIFIFFVEGDF